MTIVDAWMQHPTTEEMVAVAREHENVVIDTSALHGNARRVFGLL
jgi:predicted TIM-barrel fold metal-dependent hydrolase